MPHRQSQYVEVRRVVGKGRGVFARCFIPADTIIERVPVLVLPEAEIYEPPTKLSDYCFAWGKRTVALALGYGSLYNHSYDPNARYEDVGSQTKVFTSLRDIEAGEEITVNYNANPTDRSDVGFSVLP